MEAALWSDYLCPWCYLGRDRTRLLEDVGVAVTHLPYELHPDVPAEGRRVRPGGRLAAALAHIGSECREVGLPFTTPQGLPNTRRALEAAELVRRRWPDAFAAFDASLFGAVFVEPADLGDPGVVLALAERAGAPGGELARGLESGDGGRYVDESMARAREAGVAGTPAWLLDTGLLIPGVQPREALVRWVERLRRRAGA